MKKQIEKLALQCNAWHQVYNQKRFLVDGNFDIDKFAELMIQECIQTLVDHGYTDAADCLTEEMTHV